MPLLEPGGFLWRLRGRSGNFPLPGVSRALGEVSSIPIPGAGQVCSFENFLPHPFNSVTPQLKRPMNTV